MSLAKKIFLGSLIVFLASMLFWGTYNLSFKEKTASSEKEDTISSEGIDVDKENKKLTPITDDRVVSFILSEDGESIFYYSEDGQVFKVDLSGNNKQTISDKKLSGIKNVSWSPNKSVVLSEFQKDGKSTYSFFDYINEKGAELNDSVRSPIWQNDERILYIFDGGNSSKSGIFSSDFDGSNWKKIIDVENSHQKINTVPKSGFLSFWNEPNAFFESRFFMLSPLEQEAKLTFSGKFGGDYSWNPKGNKVLISFTDSKGGKKTHLAVMGSKGENYQELGIPTFVSKCVWGNGGETIYYALPGSLPDNPVLPNDYQDKKFMTSDTFWKINLKDGKKTRILDVSDIDEEVDAEKLLLNSDESLLFFINRRNGQLYKIAL